MDTDRDEQQNTDANLLASMEDDTFDDSNHSDCITIQELTFPELLRPSHQYTIPKADELDAQSRYVFQYLLDGRLHIVKKNNSVPFEYAPLDANTAYHARLNLRSLKQAEAALPRGNTGTRGSFKGRLQWKRGNSNANAGDRSSVDRAQQKNLSEETASCSDEYRDSITPIGDDEDPGDYFDKDVLGIDVLLGEGGLSDRYTMSGLAEKRLLSIYDPDYIYVPVIDNLRPRHAPLPFTPSTTHMHLLFKFQSFSLDHLPLPLEPLFCSISLYDVQTGRKLSESFHFTIHNDRDTLEKLDAQTISSLPQNWTADNDRLRRAILSLPEPNPNVYAVLFVEKILQHKSGAEVYLKPPKKSTLTIRRGANGGDGAINIQSTREKIKEAYKYLPPYRQPLLWSFEPLFDMETADNLSSATKNTLSDEIGEEDALDSFSKVDDVDSDQEYSSPQTTDRSSVSVPMSPNPILDENISAPSSPYRSSTLGDIQTDNGHDALAKISSPSSSRRSSTSSATTNTALSDRTFITSQTNLTSQERDPAYRNVQLRYGTLSFSNLYPLSKTDGKRRANVCHMILEHTKQPIVTPDGVLHEPNRIAAVQSSSSGKGSRTVQVTNSNKRKKKRIPGSFRMEIHDLNDEESLEQWLSPSQREYVGRKPKLLRDEWDELDHINHLRQQEFHHTQPLHNGVSYVSPFHLDYKHSLYIYPDNINFRSLGLKDFDPKNITVRILVRDNDNIDERGMPIDSVKCIVSPHSRNDAAGDGRQYEYHSITSVNYKNRYPQLFDETRIDLPLPLSNQHHLLFEFYHIITKKQPKSTRHIDRMGSAEKHCIGFSIINLLECKQIKDGWHTQPVYKNLVNGYLEKRVNRSMSPNRRSHANEEPSTKSSSLESMEIYNHGKHIFRYSLQLRSSLYPQEEKAMSLLRASTNFVERETSIPILKNLFGETPISRSISAIGEVKDINNWSGVVPFLPSIINTIIYVIVNAKGTGKSASKAPSLKAAFSRGPETQSNPSIPHSHDNTSNEQSADISNAAFEAMLVMIRGCVSLSNRIKRLDMSERDNFLVAPYISFFFTNPESSRHPVYATIIDQWNQLMTNIERRDQNDSINSRDTTVPARHSHFGHGPFKVTDTIKRKMSMSLKFSPSRKTDAKIESPNTKRATSTIKKEPGRLLKKQLKAKDSLRLSWFLFDMTIKSILLYTAPRHHSSFHQRQESYLFTRFGIKGHASAHGDHSREKSHDETPSPWTAEHIGTDKKFFGNTHKLLRKLVESMCDLLDGSDSDVNIARKTNTNIAIFICDLLDVAFQPNMHEYSAFRQFVFDLLKSYVLTSEIIKSDMNMLLRLEFLEILVDHDNFIEYCISPSTNLFSTFTIDTICQGLLDSSFKNRTRAIDIMFERILLRTDYNLKYQTEDQRNEISKLFFPFVVRLIEDEDLTKNLSLPEQHKCMLMTAQIMLNRQRTKWQEWWWHIDHKKRTKRPRSVNYLCGFVSLLFQMLRSISSNPVKIMRKTVKLTALDIFDCLVHDMKQFLVLPKDWERIKAERQANRKQMEEEKQQEPGYHEEEETNEYIVISDAKTNYYPLLEECCMLMVKFLDLNTNDEEYTRRFFLPKLYQLLKDTASRLCTHNNDPNWKACIGVLLKYVDFPLEDDTAIGNADGQITSTENGTKQLHFIVDALKTLMAPHMKDLEEELEQKRDTLKLKIEDDSEKNILINGTEIKAATLDKLIERVTNDREMDPKFREIFFITYRSFTNAFILLDKLIQRFRFSLEQDPDGGDKSTLRVINAIKLWIDKHFFDFNGILTTRLVLFLDNEASRVHNVKAFCKNLKRSLSMKLINASEDGKSLTGRSNVMFSKKPPPAIVPKNLNRDVRFELMDWSSLEFARQLTLIEYDNFRHIEPKECLSGAWAKKTKYLMAPNIAALTDRWNNVTQWVATEILRQPELKMRRIVMVKFIEIAEAFLSINNFNGVTEIMAGLSNASVYRLKRTWESMPESVMSTYKELQDLVDQQQSNKKMREALLRAPPPCVPPLSLYLKDLTFIVDGNPDTIRNGLINVFKRRQISKVILEIRQFQQAPYHFERVSYLRGIIMTRLFNNLMDDNALWSKSLELEPRQSNMS